MSNTIVSNVVLIHVGQCRMVGGSPESPERTIVEKLVILVK